MKQANQFKADTEQFVRSALSCGVDQKPSEKSVRTATNEIVKAFKPVMKRLGKREK
jgi:hypothetical protein